ncbi:YfjI family protein [bacterium]|nr:YfjI family protein [bacterium]
MKSEFRSAAAPCAKFTQTPIPLERHSLSPIPPDTFRGWFGDMIHAVSTQLETPIELAGFLGLATVATSIQGKYSVQVENGYSEPLNIWMLVAMDPSNRKSSALKSMIEPLVSYEENQEESLREVIAKTESCRQTLESVIERKRKKASALSIVDAKVEATKIADDEAALPKVPIPERLLVNDCTPEQIAVLLAKHHERISFVDSEADALFGMMMGRYSDSPKLDIYLKGYSGDSLRVDRRNGAKINLSHPLLTLGIAPQIGLIRDIAKKPALVQRGLFSRFIFSIPKSRIGSRKLESHPIPYQIQSQYGNALAFLLGLPIPDRPKTIQLSSDSYQAWKQFQMDIEHMMKMDGRLSDPVLRAWGGKLAGNTARIAALLHTTEIGPNCLPDSSQINCSVMARSIEMMRLLIDHAIAAHDLAVNESDIGRAKQLLTWIQAKGYIQVTIREIHQALKQRGAFRSAADVRSALRVLEEHGWVVRRSDHVGDKKGGRPKEIYEVHPEIHPQYPQNPSSYSFGDIGDVLAEP